MTSPVRRSELTCPGHSLKMMTRAAASEADEVIFDLEDACAVSQKIAARQAVIQALTTVPFTGDKVRAYRVNGVQTPWCYRDLIEVLEAAGKHVDVVVVPKVRTADPGKIRLEVLIETAAGLLHAEEIARASARVASLIFGVADFAGDLGARDFRQDADRLFYWPRMQLLAAARAAGIDAIDSVTVQFKDLEQLGRDAKNAAQLGFDGKWAIHPSQLPGIHAAFTPTPEEIARAQQIVAAYQQADRSGLGAIVHGDEMVDAATLKVEEKRLAVARRAGLIAG
ncbi:MAG: L-malyl-CoA/beta-methylmalyl-CoA lyase [Myxococcaceae bacterium]|nr:L-malyl-CoA/beta-methylmalyl-CoA lyase [Myxococcaceae bacterium]